MSAGVAATFQRALRALNYQTLQDVNSPIVPPYDRMPQLTAAYTRADVPVRRNQRI